MRINVEDSIMSDFRFIEFYKYLDGNLELALGCCVRLWQTAGVYWIPKKKLIPKDIFNKLKHASELKKSFMVVEKKSGFYAIGTKQNFDWIMQKRKAGLLGAKARWDPKHQVDRKNGTAMHVPMAQNASYLSYPIYQSDPVFQSNQSRSIESSVSAELDSTEVERKFLIEKVKENERKKIYTE